MPRSSDQAGAPPASRAGPAPSARACRPRRGCRRAVRMTTYLSVTMRISAQTDQRDDAETSRGSDDAAVAAAAMRSDFAQGVERAGADVAVDDADRARWRGSRIRSWEKWDVPVGRCRGPWARTSRGHDGTACCTATSAAGTMSRGAEESRGATGRKSVQARRVGHASGDDLRRRQDSRHGRARCIVRPTPRRRAATTSSVVTRRAEAAVRGSATGGPSRSSQDKRTGPPPCLAILTDHRRQRVPHRSTARRTWRRCVGKLVEGDREGLRGVRLQQDRRTAISMRAPNRSENAPAASGWRPVSNCTVYE